MKKKLLSFLLLISGISVFAQLDSITNPNFDRWASGQPTGWTTQQATQATGGDILGSNTLVLTTSGTTPGTATASFPYRMRPLSMNYVCKYVNAGGDAPLVKVTLTKTVGATTYTLASGSSTSAGSTYSVQTVNINYTNAYLAYAPDAVNISIASSGASPASTSALYIDSLQFVFNCSLDPNIISSGTDAQNAPYVDGDTVVATGGAGQPFNFQFTSYIPQQVIISAPLLGSNLTSTITTVIDSIQTSSNELSGSASSFLFVDANPLGNKSGGNSINCISISGTIPASPANAIYNIIITPLMWGTPTGASVSNVGRLDEFPSPQTITLYIKVGAGSDTITDSPNDSLHWKTMIYNGNIRRYSVYTPTIYNGSQPVPLLFNVHGWTGSSTKQMNFEDFRPIADTANFIIVHPEALGTVPSWDLNGTSDTDWLMALLDSLKAKYNIDDNRIYSTGFSQGGLMSYIFGCSFSQHFAAIAPVSGGMTNPSACKPSHYMPVMHIHGTADPLGPYSAVQSALDRMVAINQCNTTHSTQSFPDVTTADNSTVERWVYANGQCGAEVVHDKVTNGGHQCPVLDPHKKNKYGVGNRNNDYEAVLDIWNFLRKYRKDQLCSITWPPDPTSSIQESENNNLVSVYPNPSNGTFKLFVKNYENGKVKVTDLLGKTIFEGSLKSQTTTVDLSGASQGVYIYQIQNAEGVVGNGKMIVD